MVIGLLAITSIPTVAGIALGCSEQRKQNQRQADEKYMAKFYIDVGCSPELQEYSEIDGKRVVLRDNKAYIDDPLPSKRKPEAHAGQAFYIDYPEPDHLKHLKRGRGLVTTISDNPPQLNWLYVDTKTSELKYGNRTQSCDHVVGPWDWTNEAITITLERGSGFIAVQEDGAWKVCFDRDGDLSQVLAKSGSISAVPIILKRTLLEQPPQEDRDDKS